MPTFTLFISDLHLQENNSAMAEQFTALLNNCNQSINAIYILGDLFEAWIGDDDNASFSRSITQAIRQTTARGLPIYFMTGNRDFLIGKRFFKETGCIELPDEHVINLAGKQILLMHGDTLCIDDVAYMKARKLGHNKLMQWLYLSLPISLRKRIADKLRMKSMRHTTSATQEIMDVNSNEVAKKIQQHHADYLIHGHTHRPATHELTVSGKKVYRIVLGAWHENAHILVLDENGALSVWQDTKTLAAGN